MRGISEELFEALWIGIPYCIKLGARPASLVRRLRSLVLIADHERAAVPCIKRLDVE
jgi:hypothetical protein